GQVQPMLAERHDHPDPAHALHDRRVDDEGRVREHDLLAGADERPGHELDQLVGPVPHHDPVRRHVVLLRQRLAERARGAIRVAVQPVERGLQRLPHRRRRRERVLVRRELDRPGHPQLPLDLPGGLARLVGPEVEDRVVREALPGGRHRPPAHAAAGYDPRTFRNMQRSRTAARTPWVSGSSRWPSKSTKKTYSHGRRRVGRDSILVRFSRAAANGSRMRWSVPTSSRIENRTEVLSLPVRAAAWRPTTTNRVTLFAWSSIRSCRTGSA